MKRNRSLNDTLFFIGSYSHKVDFTEQVHGKGIISASLNVKTGQINTKFNSDLIFNSTYLAVSTTRNLLFSAVDNFLKPGGIMTFEIKSDGKLEFLGSQQTPGLATCHISCHPNGKRVYVTSYLNAVITTHMVNESSISQPIQKITYKGSGPNHKRQNSAHTHQVTVSPNEQYLYVCDLGSDRIWIHKLTVQGDIIEGKTSIEIPPGYGPRHLVYHPAKPLVYVLCELNAHILTYTVNDQTGIMDLIDDQPTLPVEYKGNASAAALELHPSNQTLMVSNRIHNSITVFTIDNVSGQLNFETNVSTLGDEPRDFAIDPTGNWLLSANQNSNSVIPFKLDAANGLPTGDRGPSFRCGTPVCLLFLK